MVEAATDGIREGATHGFDYVFEFDTPYTYDPSAGNLVVEWIYAAAFQLSWHDMNRAAGLDLVASFDSSGATFANFRDNAVAVEQFTFTSVLDANGDGDVTIADADLLCGTELLDDLLAELGSIRGDTDGSGEVAFADFLILSNHFGEAGKYTEGDLNCEGTVAFADFLILSDNFGERGVLASVPEPSLGVPLLVGGLGG